MKKRALGKIAVIFGTRPEIIKLSPVIRLLIASKSNHTLIHTGQHYSYNMDKIFFKDLGLTEPAHRLIWPKRGLARQGFQTAFMLKGLEEILIQEKPSVVVVQGDTNSVLAGSLAAAKLDGVKIAHVEAGLRSYDRKMPEEINRIAADHLSDFLFAPTKLSKEILIKEGVAPEKIFVTGNTVVDAIDYALKRKKNPSGAIQPLLRKPYFLLTLHRQESVDQKARLALILKALSALHKKWGVPIIFPAHPRTLKRIQEFRLRLPKNVISVEPVGYFDFLFLEKEADLILTDSGGVQEEACVLKIPCVTLRTSTERPETVDVGANLLAGYDVSVIARQVETMLSKKRRWGQPFGNGDAAQKILTILEKRRFD